MKPIKIKLSPRGWIKSFDESPRPFITFHRGPKETYKVEYTPGAGLYLLHRKMTRTGPTAQAPQPLSPADSLPIIQELLADLKRNNYAAACDGDV